MLTKLTTMSIVFKKVSTLIPKQKRGHTQKFPTIQKKNSPTISDSSPASNLTDKVRLEAARGVVPLEALPVPVPQLQAVLLLAVFVAEVVRLAGVPVGEGERPPVRDPEEAALLGQIGAGRPEVLGG